MTMVRQRLFGVRRTCVQFVTNLKLKRIRTPYVIILLVTIFVIYMQIFQSDLGTVSGKLVHLLWQKEITVLPSQETHLHFYTSQSSVKGSHPIVLDNKNRSIMSAVVNASKAIEIHARVQKKRFPDKLVELSDTLWSVKDNKKKQNIFCSPNGLVGRIGVITKITVNVSRLISSADVNVGGHWRPESCLPRFKVAIIIPYRDRQAHLITLLFYLIPILKRQQVEFRLFVVEQAGNRTFNKGTIMNAGFKEAVRISDYHCYIFHDVDLIPEDDRNLYTCPGIPRHLSVAVDKFRYTLPYPQLVGGVFAIRREDYELVNGYSNLYWGWGAEDDDMSIRLAVAGMKLSRPSATVARYKMLKHSNREHVPGKWISYLLKTVKKRFSKDGLSTVNYNVTFVHMEPLFTHIMIDVGEPPKIVGNISAITGR